ncbi:DUF1194 domain-containing protein [Amylibacter sp.]|nr:DUF1194 domain-containing protein [Amylibacter sp.]
MKRFFLPFVFLFMTIRAAVACEVALVVALDVSRSVDRTEYALMRDGIASAFLDDEVRQLIEWLPGGLMVTVTQWGGAGQQRQAIGWHRIQGKAGIVEFVESFTKQTRGYWMADTAVSEALIHADQMFGGEAARCRRKVIDVSGDGISNAGPAVAPVAFAIGSKGVTINGLVITGAKPNPVPYFEKQVIGGPFAFVEVANSYADYPRAMKRKLLRELTPAYSMLVD